MLSIGPDGQWQELDASQIHQFDQVQEHFSQLSRALSTCYMHTQEAVRAKDTQAAHDIAKQVLDLLNGQFGDKPEAAYVFIMHLIECLVEAADWTDKVINLADGMWQAVAWILPEQHPANQLLQQEKSGNVFVTGTGQRLRNIHTHEECTGPFCVIHRPCPGPWGDWPTNWRGDDPMDIWRGFERICGCGVGHPAVEELLRGHMDTHGCCGTCPCGPAACEEITTSSGELVGYRVKGDSE